MVRARDLLLRSRRVQPGQLEGRLLRTIVTPRELVKFGVTEASGIRVAIDTDTGRGFSVGSSG